MAGYRPLKIAKYETGLVQERQEFILPADAYPTLENAFVWRERIKRKQGCERLGRLRRVLAASSIGNITASGAGTFTFNIFTGLGLTGEPDAEIEQGSITNISIAIGPAINQTLTDTTGDGTLAIAPAGVITAATINYATGDLILTFSGAASPSAATFTGAYYPGLPVMGLRSRELNAINNEMTVAFDTKYSYRFNNGWQIFPTGSATTWTGTNSEFFWTTNFWVDQPTNAKLFWATNFSGTGGDPIRYTDGLTWTDFAPQINAAGDKLNQCLAMLPFRGRMVVFNTLEGANLATSTAFFQRIRWASIGNPLDSEAWLDDKRGKGGFLNIPTSESIVSVGFVRDNLVIYCERSTWQLRYTGRSIAPFQIEKVNSELGAESTFSAVQFDTSLVGIGDKGVVECDSYKSERIDIKIPDLVYVFNNTNFGVDRVYGVRDFQQRIAYWVYPFAPEESEEVGKVGYPDRRLVYNYENDSWAIFKDSFTCLGTFQRITARTWGGTPIPWGQCNFPWVDRQALFPSIVGGNQQGFVVFLDVKTTNDPTLAIQDITGNTTTPTVITSPSHNLETKDVIVISDIPTGTPFANTLNGNVFSVVVTDPDTFKLYKYSAVTGRFSDPQLDPPGTYIGAGRITIRDNFNIVSKKFGYLDEGQKIQMGYLDILMDTTENGAITMNVYIDYNDDSPVNTLPQNVVESTSAPDPFFNVTIPTSQNSLNTISGTKMWQRVFCPTRGQFITLQFTFSNAQMAGIEQEEDVQIDSQILWTRPAGRLI